MTGHHNFLRVLLLSSLLLLCAPFSAFALELNGVNGTTTAVSNANIVMTFSPLRSAVSGSYTVCHVKSTSGTVSSVQGSVNGNYSLLYDRIKTAGNTSHLAIYYSTTSVEEAINIASNGTAVNAVCFSITGASSTLPFSSFNQASTSANVNTISGDVLPVDKNAMNVLDPWPGTNGRLTAVASSTTMIQGMYNMNNNTGAGVASPIVGMATSTASTTYTSLQSVSLPSFATTYSINPSVSVPATSSTTSLDYIQSLIASSTAISAANAVLFDNTLIFIIIVIAVVWIFQLFL